jgi:hypothetical protein
MTPSVRPSLSRLDRPRDACPGWDRQWLLLRYLEFRAGKPAPKNPNLDLRTARLCREANLHARARSVTPGSSCRSSRSRGRSADARKVFAASHPDAKPPSRLSPSAIGS